MVKSIKSLISWAFRPKIILIGISLFLIAIFLYFFGLWQHRNQIREKAFSKVKISIDTSKFPLTYNDYLVSQSKNKKNSGYYELFNEEPKEIDSLIHDNYCHKKECFLLIEKLIKKLDTNKKNNSSVTIQPGLRASYEVSDYHFYYNKFGQLVYVQSVRENPCALYDTQGNLVHAKIMRGYSKYYFDSRKRLVLFCGLSATEDWSPTTSCRYPLFNFF